MLTAQEKQAGRRFRDVEQALLDRRFETDPPTYTVNGLIAVYRHPCPARGGVSSMLELREIYLHSPPYTDPEVPAGRFGFIYREGSCRQCGHTALSRIGRIVDAGERPPLSG